MDNKIKSIWLFLIVIFFVITNIHINAAEFSFSNENITLAANCERYVDIILDTNGVSSSGADIIINYNPQHIEIIDSMPNIPGIQIKPGSIFEGYFGSTVNTQTGIITLSAASASAPFNGKNIFGSILLKSNPGISSTNLNIIFNGTGNTFDSNIVNQAGTADILTLTRNVSLNFEQTTCTINEPESQITSNPFILFINPKNSTDEIKNTDNIIFKIIGNGQNIDISSLSIKLNNKSYTSSSPEVKIIGDQNRYTIEISGFDALPNGSYSIIQVSINNFDGETTQATLYFNINRIKPQIDETICEEAEQYCSLTNQIKNDIQNIPIIKTLTESPIIQYISNNIPEPIRVISEKLGVAGFLTSILSSALLANILGLLLLTRSPYLLFAYLGLVKRRNPWGIIYDINNSKPVAFAVIRAYIKNSKALLLQTVSDMKGKYGLLLDPGEYRITVSHPEYKDFEQNILLDQPNFMNDIGLIPKEGNIQKLLLQIRPKNLLTNYTNFFDKNSRILNIFGLIISTFAIIIKPNILNLAFFILYLSVFIVYSYTHLRSRNFIGKVFDSSSNLVIPKILIKIFNKNSWELVDTYITDQKGRFPINLDPGVYAILASSKNYNFPSDKQKELELIKEKPESLLELDIKEGMKTKVEIYLDPKGNIKDDQNKFDSPFS